MDCSMAVCASIRPQEPKMAAPQAIQERTDFQVPLYLPENTERKHILQDALAALNGICPIDLLSSATKSHRRTLSKKLVDLTDGFSAREIRHLVVEALTFKDLSVPLRMGHLIKAAQHKVSQRAHHTETGGVYINDYQRKAV